MEPLTEQPDWCRYPGAMVPMMGCYSLLGGHIRTEKDCAGPASAARACRSRGASRSTAGRGKPHEPVQLSHPLARWRGLPEGGGRRVALAPDVPPPGAAGPGGPAAPHGGVAPHPWGCSGGDRRPVPAARRARNHAARPVLVTAAAVDDAQHPVEAGSAGPAQPGQRAHAAG